VDQEPPSLVQQTQEAVRWLSSSIACLDEDSRDGPAALSDTLARRLLVADCSPDAAARRSLRAGREGRRDAQRTEREDLVLGAAIGDDLAALAHDVADQLAIGRRDKVELRDEGGVAADPMDDEGSLAPASERFQKASKASSSVARWSVRRS
jgi:hypothetical protein